MTSNTPSTTLFSAGVLFSGLLLGSVALAAGSAASTASDSASSAASSTSDSVNASSAGSSKATGVAAGDYRIVDITAVAERPDVLRIRLAAVAPSSAEEPFELLIPGKTVRAAELNTGSKITVNPRPYGVELADTQTRVPFFLVLHDEWHRDLNTRVLSL